MMQKFRNRRQQGAALVGQQAPLFGHFVFQQNFQARKMRVWCTTCLASAHCRSTSEVEEWKFGHIDLHMTHDNFCDWIASI